jgi:hypothetical protein
MLVPRAALPVKSRCARLEREGERILLRYCSADIEKFAAEMLLLEGDYARRLRPFAGSPAPASE